jgi:hypothetical protein
MTCADVQAATAYTKTLHVQRLLSVREWLPVALDEGTESPSSRNTYGNRLERFLPWCESQSWWPCARLLRIQDQCCPPRQLSGRRHHSDLPLTSRRGKYLPYRLTEKETPAALQKELVALEQYLVAPCFPERVGESVKAGTGKGYLKDIRLCLGFRWQHQQEPVALD